MMAVTPRDYGNLIGKRVSFFYTRASAQKFLYIVALLVIYMAALAVPALFAFGVLL
ncbi:MAG: hypothetical protein SCH66_14905 [Methanolobus sp.]|nr:hypothetical protein [Methanolobus sp.]